MKLAVGGLDRGRIKVGGLVQGLPDMRSCKVTGSFSSLSDR